MPGGVLDVRLLVEVWSTTRRVATSVLLKDAAHELRNRLGVLQANIIFVRNAVRELQSSRFLPSMTPDERSQLAELGSACDDISTATLSMGDALAIARERADQDAHPTPVTVDTAPFLRAVLDEAKSCFDAPIHFDATPGLPVVRADPSRLVVILLELLANAERAVVTRSGGSIVVRLRNDGGAVVLGVEDNGPGLGAVPLVEAVRPKIVGAEKEPRMGLALCKELARGMGAELHIVSSETGLAARVRMKPA